MKQYMEIKEKYPDSILLFRVGDFYETFHEDAIITSKVLGIILTKRGSGANKETKLAGFPYHSFCLLYTSPSPRDATLSRMPSSA